MLRHLDRSGATGFTPVFTAVHEADVAPAPFLDFTSGYVQRASAMLPQQGNRKPWRLHQSLHQSYLLDLLALRFGKVADGVMAFTRGGRG